MSPKLKRILKKTFPLGLLIFAHRQVGKVKKLIMYPKFFTQWSQFKSQVKKNNDNRFVLTSKNFSPILHEMASTQYFDRHYVYHLAWAARKMKQINPEHHHDISSSLHFSTIVSAFLPVTFYDYRPADLKLSNLESKHADLMSLPFSDNSVQSLSCMHTVEHVGLGRYGDPIDPTADLKAMKELSRVLAPGGHLLFVVPVGKSKLLFNEHRIYGFDQIVESFPELELKEFSLLPDEGAIQIPADPAMVKDQIYGCGCFWFTKPHKV